MADAAEKDVVHAPGSQLHPRQAAFVLDRDPVHDPQRLAVAGEVAGAADADLRLRAGLPGGRPDRDAGDFARHERVERDGGLPGEDVAAQDGDGAGHPPDRRPGIPRHDRGRERVGPFGLVE